MRDLASGTVTDDPLRILQLQRIFINVQQILSHNPESDLDKLAELAHHSIEYLVPGVNVINSVAKRNHEICDDNQKCLKSHRYNFEVIY